MLGVEPTRQLPGAYLRFLRVDGTGLDNPVLDDKALTGPIPTVLRRLDELLTLNIHTAVVIGTGTTDVRRPDYPLAALQQLARERNGNPPVEWDVDVGYVALTLRKAS